MNKQKFVELLKSPEKISGNDFAELEDLLKKNPYFQSGHTVLAKGSRLLKKNTSSKVMSRAAIYATNRNIFKQYILSQGKVTSTTKSTPVESPYTPTSSSNAPVRKAPEHLPNTEQDNLIKEIYDNLEQWKNNRDHYLEYDKSHPEDIVIKDVVNESNETVEKLKNQVAEEVKAEDKAKDKAKEVEALEAEMLAYTAEKAREAEERKQKTSDISGISSSETNPTEITESKTDVENDKIIDSNTDPTGDDDAQEVNPSSVYRFDAIPEPQELPAELSTPKKEVEEVKQEAADTLEVSSSEREAKDTIESKVELEKGEITDASSAAIDDDVQEVNPSSVYKFDAIPEPQELPAELSTPKKEVEEVKQEAADTPEVSSSEREAKDTIESKVELEKGEITDASSDPVDDDIQEVSPSSVYKFDAIPEPQELPAELSTPKKEVEEIKQEAADTPEVSSSERKANDTIESKVELEKGEITDASSDSVDDDTQEVSPSSVYKFDSIPEPQELPAEFTSTTKTETEEKEDIQDSKGLEISSDELTEIVDRETKEEEKEDNTSLDKKIDNLEIEVDSGLDKVEKILDEVKEIEGNPETGAELDIKDNGAEVKESGVEVEESIDSEDSSATNDSNELKEAPVEKVESEQHSEPDSISADTSVQEPDNLVKEETKETQEVSKEDIVEDKLEEIEITEPEVTLSDAEPSVQKTEENISIDSNANSEEALDEIDKEKKDLKLQPGLAPKAKKFRLSVMKRPINFTKAKKSSSKEKSKKSKPVETQKSKPIEKNDLKEEKPVVKEEKNVVKVDEVEIKDIELKEEKATSKKSTTEKDEIIDKFLKDEPSITPMAATSKTDITTTKDLARKEINFPGDFATENLASILEMQGKSQRAIETYEKLIIDHPDKKDIYKAHIEKLKSTEESETDSVIDTDALFVNFMNNHPDIPVLSWDDLKLVINSQVVQNDQINKQEFITENIAQILQVLGETTAAIKVYARLRVQHPEKAEEYDFIIEQLNKELKRG